LRSPDRTERVRSILFERSARKKVRECALSGEFEFGLTSGSTTLIYADLVPVKIGNQSACFAVRNSGGSKVLLNQ
jgi:hypothetical protein